MPVDNHPSITILLVNEAGIDGEQLAEKFLQRVACRVLHARSIDQALATMDHLHIDIVVADSEVPEGEGTGSDLLRIISAQSGTPPLLILMTSATKHLPEENLSGIATVFRRPISMEALVHFAMDSISSLATAAAV